MIDDAKLAKWEALVAATTEPQHHWSCERREDGTAQVYTSGPGPCRGVLPIAETRAADGAFMAAAHTAVPELIAEVRELHAAIEATLKATGYLSLTSLAPAYNDLKTRIEPMVAERDTHRAQRAHDALALDAMRQRAEKAEATGLLKKEKVLVATKTLVAGVQEDLLAVLRALVNLHRRDESDRQHAETWNAALDWVLQEIDGLEKELVR